MMCVKGLSCAITEQCPCEVIRTFGTYGGDTALPRVYPQNPPSLKEKLSKVTEITSLITSPAPGEGREH